MVCAVIVDMVKRQKGFLGLTATRTLETAVGSISCELKFLVRFALRLECSFAIFCAPLRSAFSRFTWIPLFPTDLRGFHSLGILLLPVPIFFANSVNIR